MSYNYIEKIAYDLITRYKSCDPFDIAQGLGIKIMYRSDFTKLKGMYAIICDSKYIFINSNLPWEMQRIVCAHELGHSLLHDDLARSSVLQEFMLYDMKNRPEYEANLFASSLLIDSKEFISLAQEGYDVVQLASILNTDINLILIKMSLLKDTIDSVNLNNAQHHL
ncbi:protein of unknown function [Hathewaya proteolytica DSM 3090]|uniref:IrrE N-terminal-like domain-containing protein n=1 Tax=Hathewaya proteolytica DSM 3090 TaxID=1121331 RepID=A0A1M6QLN9_9CLOT|nr:ImmA/IrrE family metallo-endopeptidase [Hathewaya proteolytica]SHK21020.1 protein of unknown function [Hathewaya proteolytica DSM 3090]